MKNILERPLENKLEMLKNNFPECFDGDGNFNIQKFQEIISPNTKIFKDSYGLNWLGKSYARRLATLPISTVLSEDIEHNEKEENKNSENIYIKGDNLEVLRHLISAYSEKIKMIYIDPPYNTKNGEFVYNDNRAFTEKELEKLVTENIIDEDEKERILYWIDNKSSSHSAWLTFMFPRLYLARKFLREDGVIFISIDDNEASQLRLLCDEVFGEENFIETLIWKKRATPPNDREIGKNHEEIYIYSKNIKKIELGLQPRNDKLDARYSNPDNDIRGRWTASDLSANGKGGRITESCIYGIENPLTKEIYMPPKNKCWLYNKEKIEFLIKDKRIGFREKTGTPYLKKFLSDVRQGTTLPTLLDKHGFSQNSAKEIKELFEMDIFEFPKPINLIKTLLNSGNIKEDYILDFFAGSSTTAHAVMQLNAEDGGDGKYIMVQLEEEIQEKVDKNGKIKKPESLIFCEKNNLIPNITSIGIERIKRAAKKIKEETGAKIDYGFKIYSVKDVPNKIQESMDKFNPITPQLFETKILTEEEKNAVLTTYKVYDGNLLTTKIEKIKLDVEYIGYKVGTVLYLIEGITNSNIIKNIIEKLDSDREFAIDKIVIYGYAHGEGRYRAELSENIKTYTNKKEAKIDIEVRY